MNFNTWLKGYTGLTVYDYYALIWGEHTEEKADSDLENYLNQWIEEKKPSTEDIQKANDLIKSHGKEQ